MKIQPLKSVAALALGALVSLCQAGCSFSGLDAQNLMSPPRANLDQQEIYELMQGERQELTFVYPNRGANRSAIILRDWTGDGVSDAVGFTESEAGSVEVFFLEKTQDGWRTAASFENTATQVDLVLFGDVNGDGREDVLIGWGSAAGTTGRTAAVAAYLYQDRDVSEYSLSTYGEMVVTDFDGDGVSEVFTVDKYLPAEEEGAEALPAMAHLFAWRDGAPRELSVVAADNSLTSYVSIAFGQLHRGATGVVLDGAKADGSLTTQVFTLEGGRLVNLPAGVNTEGYQNPCSRPSTAPFISQDINQDGSLELPVTSKLPCISPEVTPDSTSYLVEWSRMGEDGKYESVLTTLMNLGENYWFRLPYALRGKVSASNNTSTRTVTYTEVVTAEDGTQLLGSPLFAIRVFTRSAWESRGETSGYELLAAQNDLVYGLQPLTQETEYLRAIQQVQQYFTVTLE